jgi:histidine triad (HIT) family protein
MENKINDCIFCKIASGYFNTTFFYQDSELVIFSDINPQAPIHMLIVPRKHITSLNSSIDDGTVVSIFNAIKTVQSKINLSDYRVVINTGEKAGQTVFHLHIHFLAGRMFLWPPG